MSPIVAPHGPLPKIPEGSGKLKLGALVFNGVDLLDVSTYKFYSLQTYGAFVASQDN